MGGGGAMRAVAKAAGIGVVASGGLRGGPSLPSTENMVSAAARKASRPVGAIVSSHDGVTGGEAVAPVQRPSFELSDWELSGYGYEEDYDLVDSDPLPRVVFGGVPTMKEATEATSELKDVLEKVYLKSPSSPRSEGSFIVDQEPSLPILLSNPETSETKACFTSGMATSKHAFHAFKLLSESTAAQTVVASIACDPNVWTAVMKNEELTKYLQSNKIAASFPEMDLNANESAADGNCQEQDPNDVEELFGESQSGNLGTGFTIFLENVKRTVVDMFSNLSSFVQSTFGGSASENKSMDADGSDKATFMDTTAFGSSFMGLAVFVIMLVVMKRG